MNFANSLIQLFNNLWSLASGPSGYICNLKDNVKSLRTATDWLKAKSTDVLAVVERQEGGGGVRRTEEVACWLDTVQKFVARADQILPEAEERDQIICLCRCVPPNCRSIYELGKGVNQMLNEAKELQTKGGELGVVTSLLPPPPVLRMPMGKTVGLDTSLDEVWKWLVDKKQGVIGLYGLGGVGKTTLMKKINEKLSRENPEFQVVIWIVVSRQVNKETIRDTIRKRLGIDDQIWNGWSQEGKVHHLCQALTRKKFVLLIDDLWARLDLPEIGVPHGLQNGSKIVFTTREKQICAQMGAEKTSFEVRCLTTEEALKLFRENAGESTVKSHPEIQELANKIADECKGLPLALTTVGRAMAGIANPQEWEQALATLRKNPHKFSGMEEEVYHILAFSYNRLDDSNLQHCFLYCCLFPEDYHMRPHDLIGLWIGEGLLGDTNDVYSLRIEGERVLGRLNRACLLESGHDDYVGAHVKMHDVIRDMATWITRDHGKKEHKWLVIERGEDLSAKTISKWGDVEKVSIWGQQIIDIDQKPPRCSQLKTLIVRETCMSLIPRGFFDLMAARLTVLDLSDNRSIRSFPEDICNLINLQYLNLSRTFIKKLPRDIEKLTHLWWLLLESIETAILIPIGTMTSLPLNVLSLWGSWSKEEEEMVNELGRMQHLADLSIEVRKSSSVHKIFQFLNLQGSIRRVAIVDCLDLTRIVISHPLLHLKILFLTGCNKLMHMEIRDGIGRVPNCFCFPSLTDISIFECGLSDLSWLVHAPKLRELTIKQCPSVEKIIGDGFVPGKLTALRLFSRLEYVGLWDLSNLTSICNEALSFPQGVHFSIFGCPGLIKLPLDSSSARGGSFSVKGDKGWWVVFEWDPTARVTCQLEGSPVEEMTYGEARQKALTGRLYRSQHRMEDEHDGSVEIGFLPHGPSE